MAYSLEELLRLQEASPSSSASQVRGGTLTPYRPPPPATVNTAPLTNAGGGDDVDGSAFTNFGRFFNANAEKAGAMAQRASDKVQSSGESLQADVKKANSDFYTGLNAGTPAAYGGENITDGSSSSRNWAGSGGQSLQSKGQGLDSSQPSTPGGAPAGAITPAEAQARAGQTYSGPTGLAGYGSLIARGSDVGSQARNLDTQSGRAGILSDTYGTAVDSRAAALNSALTGIAGQSRFHELAKRFGDSTSGIESKQAAAQQEAKNAKAFADERGGYYQNQLDGYNATTAKADAKAAADKAAGDADTAARKKSKTLDQYMTPDAGYYLERGAELTSPIDSAMRYVGGKESIMSGLTDQWEKMLGSPLGGHRSAKDELGKYTRDVQEKVYDSMTQQEADALQGMGPAEQQKWIWDRVQRLGLSGTNQRT